MFAQDDKTTKQIVDKLRASINELPNSMQHLPPELRADLNRMAQKVLKNGSNIGRVDISDLMKGNDELMKMEAKIRTTDYGTNTTK